MKRHLWKILAVDLAAGLLFGGALLSGGGSSPTVIEPSPSPSWGLFSPAQWQTVEARLGSRGFDIPSARVVGGTILLPQRQPFALIAATSKAGQQCFVPVRGVALDRTICRLHEPLTVFTAPGTVTTVIGLAGQGVVGVSIEDRAGHITGVGLVSVGGVPTFVMGVAGGRTLRAYGTHGHVLVRMKFRA